MPSRSGEARVLKAFIGWAGAALVLAACAPPKPAPPPAPAVAVPIFDTSIPLKDFMQRVLDPQTDIVWSAGGVVVDFKGEHDLSPKTDEEWAKIRDAATAMAEGGNVLQLPGYAREGATWGRQSQAITRLGLEAMKAADAKDKDAMLRIGGDIHDACEECHRVYVLGEKPKP
jgi:hypothetical protein